MFNNIDSFPLQVFFFHSQLPPLSSNKLHKSETLKVLHVTWGSLLFRLSWPLGPADLGSLISEPLPAPVETERGCHRNLSCLLSGFSCSEPSPTNSFSTLQPRWPFRRTSLMVHDLLVSILSLVALWPSEHSLVPGVVHEVPPLARAGPRHSSPHSRSYRWVSIKLPFPKDVFSFHCLSAYTTYILKSSFFFLVLQVLLRKCKIWSIGAFIHFCWWLWCWWESCPSRSASLSAFMNILKMTSKSRLDWSIGPFKMSHMLTIVSDVINHRREKCSDSGYILR